MYKKDLVSVIIPVYNVEAYIEKCITSIINQTYKKLEIIVVNDGTKDNSMDIVEKYKDDRFLIVNKENGGLSSARNAGLDVATGEYIYFIDSDDWIDDGYIEELVSTIRENRNYNLVQNENINMHLIDDGNKLYINQEKFSGVYTIKDRPFFVYWGLWSFMFKHKFLKENDIRFVEGYNYEDYAFQALCIPYIKKYKIFFGKNSYNYIKRNSSITGLNSKDNTIPMDIVYQFDKTLDKYIERNIDVEMFPFYMLFLFLYEQRNVKEYLKGCIKLIKKAGIDISRLNINDKFKKKYKDLFEEF